MALSPSKNLPNFKTGGGAVRFELGNYIDYENNLCPDGSNVHSKNMELVYRFPFKCDITLLVGFGRGSDQWEGTIFVEQVDCPSFVSNLVPTSSPLFVGLLLQIPVYPSSPFAALHSLYLCIWVSNCWNLWQGFGWKKEFLPSVICVFLPGEHVVV